MADAEHAPRALVVLHEDEDVLVLDKPSGLVVHRGFSGDTDSVVDRLREAGRKDVHPVHRLDRGTSGVLVCAKHVEAARELGRAFSEGDTEKHYVALVRGALVSAVVVDHPIPKDEGGERVDARTTLEPLGTARDEGSPLREKRYSLVAARPHTGRFHQVRRHLKHLGHPVIGDTTYGRSEHNARLREAFGLDRLFLHARALRFRVGGRALSITSPLPLELARVLDRLHLGRISASV